MRRSILLTVAVLSAACTSCTNLEGTATGAHATVVMRDGKRLKGSITQSTTLQITLVQDDKLPIEIQTDQVKLVSYDTPDTPGPDVAVSADAAHEEHYHPAENKIRSRSLLLMEGAEFPVRLEETIDSSKAVEGQTYAAEVARDLTDAKGDVVVPRGSNAMVVIRSASKGDRFHSALDLQLDLLSVSVEGQKYTLNTSDIVEHGRDGVGKNRRTGIFAGGGAAVGSIIGAIAGGGKGAAIGAGSGAGAGLLTQLLTKGNAIKVPAETVLTFKLDQPLRVVAAR